MDSGHAFCFWFLAIGKEVNLLAIERPPSKKYKNSLYSRSFNHFRPIYQCLNFGQAWKPNISNGTGFFRQSIIKNRTSANVQFKMYNVSCSVYLQSSFRCRDSWYNEHVLQSTLVTHGESKPAYKHS